MENKEFFKALENLKSSLEEISSARQQVTETVCAYGKTETKLQSCANDLMKIEESINKFVNLLKNQKSEIEKQSSTVVDSVKQSCDKITEQTKTKVESIAKKFAEETENSVTSLSNQITRYNGIVDRTEKMSDNIANIEQKVVSLPEQLKSLKESVIFSDSAIREDIRKLSGIAENQIKTLENEEKILQKYSGTLSQHSEKLNDLLKTTQSNGVVASNTFASLTTQHSLILQQEEVLKEVKNLCGNATKEVGNCRKDLSSLWESLTKQGNILSEHSDKLKKLSETVEEQHAMAMSTQKNMLYVNCAILLGVIISIVLHFL